MSKEGTPFPFTWRKIEVSEEKFIPLICCEPANEHINRQYYPMMGKTIYPVAINILDEDDMSKTELTIRTANRITIYGKYYMVR